MKIEHTSKGIDWMVSAYVATAGHQILQITNLGGAITVFFLKKLQFWSISEAIKFFCSILLKCLLFISIVILEWVSKRARKGLLSNHEFALYFDA